MLKCSSFEYKNAELLRNILQEKDWYRVKGIIGSFQMGVL